MLCADSKAEKKKKTNTYAQWHLCNTYISGNTLYMCIYTVRLHSIWQLNFTQQKMIISHTQ